MRSLRPSRLVPGAVLGLASFAPAQEEATLAGAGSSPTAAVGWIDPVLPPEWEAQEPPPPPEGWVWDADGLLSLHAIDYGDRNTRDTGIETETATVILTGRYGDDFRFWFEPDFDGEDTRNNLQEVWGEWSVTQDHWVRLGLLKVALGSEFGTRSEDWLFPGYAFPSWLAGRYDYGLRYDAYPSHNFWHQFTATVGQGFDFDGRDRETPFISWRGIWTYDQNPGHDFEGIYGGPVFAWGSDGDEHVYLGTPAEQTTFITDDLDGEETQWIGWEMGVRQGPFRTGIETISGEISEVPTGATTNDMDELTSWSAFMSWNFTGDAPAWMRGGWAPYTQADYDAGKALPIEFGIRYSNADIDRDLFDFGLTTYDPSSQETRSLSAAISAHLDPDTRLALEWAKIIADDPLSVFEGHGRTTNIILRWDQWFGR